MDHNRAYKLGRAFRLGLAFSLGKQHQQGMAMDRWITIHPFGEGKNADYARIFINDDTGVIETGAGGRFNGKTLKEAFSKESKSSESQQATKTPKAIYVTYPNGIESMLFSIEGEPDKIHDDGGNYYDVKGGLQTAIERAKAIGAKVENYDPDDPYDPNSSPWNRDRKKKAEQQARLPGQRKEVQKVKPKHRADFKDEAKPETHAFMDEFAKGMSKAKSNLDFEFYGQRAMQKALKKLPDGTVFVNNYEYGYYLKQDGQWYKKDYETPDGYSGMDVTEPPNFADTGMNGKLFFGIGGNLKQAEANKKVIDYAGVENKQTPKTDSTNYDRQKAKDALLEGGKEWKGGKHHRIYIDPHQAAKFIGLELDSYKTGNIKNARFNGEKISNNKAWKMWSALNDSYYDVYADRVVTKSEYLDEKFNKA